MTVGGPREREILGFDLFHARIVLEVFAFDEISRAVELLSIEVISDVHQDMGPTVRRLTRVGDKIEHPRAIDA